jgi:hypothetical protein
MWRPVKAGQAARKLGYRSVDQSSLKHRSSTVLQDFSVLVPLNTVRPASGYSEWIVRHWDRGGQNLPENIQPAHVQHYERLPIVQKDERNGPKLRHGRLANSAPSPMIYFVRRLRFWIGSGPLRTKINETCWPNPLTIAHVEIRAFGWLMLPQHPPDHRSKDRHILVACGNPCHSACY